MVLTAYHVVSEATEITVEFPDGSEFTGELLGRDLGRDLAMIGISASGLVPTPLANFAELRVGQTLTKLGYGLGQEGPPAATQGIISALHEPNRVNPSQVQTDTAVNAGDSGSPLLTRGGAIAGIVASKLVAVDVEGVGFASALPGGQDLIRRLAEGETICQPAPELHEAATDPLRTYRDNVFAWYVQFPVGFKQQEFDFGRFFWESPLPSSFPKNRYAFPAVVYIYDPILKSEYATAELFFDAWLASFQTLDGLSVSYLIGPHEVCRGEEIAWEAELIVQQPDDPGVAIGTGWVSRERWLAVDSGDTWYLLRAAAWPERFDGLQRELDTLLYTFRFDKEPLLP